MNTVRSVGYGWGILVLAGGGAYFFAKRSVNSDREERAHEIERKRQHMERLRNMESDNRHRSLPSQSPKATSSPEFSQRDPAVTGPANAKRKGAVGEDHPSPSREAAGEPAPVTHEQETAAAKGRYEAAEPYRSRKGDRFS